MWLRHAIGPRPSIAWIALLYLVGLVSWASAQALQRRSESTVVLSGSDIGFRVDSHRGSVPIGKLVVRVDGQWVEAQFSGGVMKIGAP
jgi:hypothetical protein